MHNRVQMETFGWFLEYYVNGKFIGTKKIQEKEREEIGYYSTVHSTAEENIKLDNKKVIKQGTQFYTRQYPLTGRVRIIETK